VIDNSASEFYSVLSEFYFDDKKCIGPAKNKTCFRYPSTIYPIKNCLYVRKHFFCSLHGFLKIKNSVNTNFRQYIPSEKLE